MRRNQTPGHLASGGQPETPVVPGGNPHVEELEPQPVALLVVLDDVAPLFQRLDDVEQPLVRVDRIVCSRDECSGPQR
jgi:hypothetical protein